MVASVLVRALSTQWVYFVVSLFYHLLYTLCALDVFYRSPIQDIGGLAAHQSSMRPLASRVVFVTLDGAPADVVFSAAARDLISERDGTPYSGPTAPFLASVLNATQGDVCWGVTHTHVPTESRPGHVSLIAGLYEDPSAVTTGWQHNPNKSFDTVWKEATYVWQWGAPEIVNIFAGEHIETYAFPDEINDFAQDPAIVDAWVSDNMTQFFASAPHDAALMTQLASERVVFFLHYLGMDSAGHKFGTEGVGYLETLTHVDACLRKAKQTFDTFYGDDRTVMIVTADHGMTKRGSHGDGSPSETRVPLLVFGSGVSKTCKQGASGIKFWQEAFASVEEEEEYTRERWGRDPGARIDVEPADVSMLMAAFLSSPLPVHGEGSVPVEYLSDNVMVRAHARYANVNQARERVHGAASVRRTRCTGWFSEWKDTAASEALFEEVTAHLQASRHTAALDTAERLIALLHEGALYYREYDRFFMISAVAFAYAVWGMYCVAVAAQGGDSDKATLLPLLIGYALVLPTIHLQGMTWRDGCYLVAPFHLLPFILAKRVEVARFLGTISLWGLLLPAVVVGTTVVGFHMREAFSLTFGVLAGVQYLRGADGVTAVMFALTGLFTLLPCVGSDLIYIVSPVCMLLSGVFNLSTHQKRSREFGLPGALWFISAALVGYTDYLRSISDTGLPPLNQYAAWSLLVISLLLPRMRLQSVPPPERLQYVLLCLQPPMTLLSVGYEPLFLGALCLLLVRYERVEERKDERAVSVMLMMLLYFAFFATGNIASVSSFDLPSVYRLQTHFDKAVMGALLILKLLLPMLGLLSAVLFYCRDEANGVFNVVALTVALSDIVALIFFATLRDTGSWKQIGHSISRYVIANLLTLLLLILWGLARAFVGEATKKLPSKDR